MFPTLAAVLLKYSHTASNWIYWSHIAKLIKLTEQSRLTFLTQWIPSKYFLKLKQWIVSYCTLHMHCLLRKKP